MTHNRDTLLKKEKMLRSKSTIGQMLLKSLTSEQIAGLLTVVSASTDLNQFMDEFTKIDPDMAATVKKILAADQGSVGRGETKPAVSLKRTMEFWASLWRRFDDVIGELGNEDGKYAVQDHHWEAPYFVTDRVLPMIWSLSQKTC